MAEISSGDVSAAINGYLEKLFVAKTESDLRSLEQAVAKGDDSRVEKLRAKIAQVKKMCQLDQWIEKYRTGTLTLEFATHISKGIHPSSTGPNVVAKYVGNHDFVSSHLLTGFSVDSTGNASLTPLANFLNQEVKGSITIRDLIIAKDPAIQGCFATDVEVSREIEGRFYDLLTSTNTRVDSLNKQIYWPIKDGYRIIVPLYSSVLSNEVWRKVWAIRMQGKKASSDDVDTDHVAENPVTENMESSRFFSDYAVVSMGGSKPQNISRLNSQQSGIHFLFASLPPQFSGPAVRLPRYAVNVFNHRGFSYLIRGQIQDIAKIFANEVNNVVIRAARDHYLDEIIAITLRYVSDLQRNPPGWTESYHSLPNIYKHLLDPLNDNLSDEELPSDETILDIICADFALKIVLELQEAYRKVCKGKGVELGRELELYIRKVAANPLSAMLEATVKAEQ